MGGDAMNAHERARLHVVCDTSQCHVIEHCDRCNQVWPCDAALLLEAVEAVEAAERIIEEAAA
jgi:hypothetical protein